MELTEKNYKEDFCAKKISVIIPMYNAEKYIKKTLNSIIEQSYQKLGNYYNREWVGG